MRVQITALLEDWMPEAFWIRLADIVLDNLAQQGQPNDPDDD